MKKLPLLFLGLILNCLTFGQSISPEVIASSGDHFTGTDAQLSWTIGELVIDTYTNGSTQLTQGFHQTNLIITNVEVLADALQVMVFPNPATDQVNIEWSESVEGYTLLLYDVIGQQLLLQETFIQSISKLLDFSAYAAGSYFLHLRNADEKTIKIFKILKIK